MKQHANKRRKPRIVVKGALAGFMIADTSWEPEFVDSILEKLSEANTPLPEIAEDKDFINEKE